MVKRAYEVSPPGATGQQLRFIVVQTVTKHAKEIFTRGTEFKAMMDNVPSFGSDLSQALSGCYPGVQVRSYRDSQDNSYYCNHCHFMFGYQSNKHSSLYCPRQCFDISHAAAHRPRLLTLYGTNVVAYECASGHKFEAESPLVAIPMTCIACHATATRIRE
jgi:hypothetical protein